MLSKFYFEHTVQITWAFYTSRRLKWPLPRFFHQSIQSFFLYKNWPFISSVEPEIPGKNHWFDVKKKYIKKPVRFVYGPVQKKNF